MKYCGYILMIALCLIGASAAGDQQNQAAFSISADQAGPEGPAQMTYTPAKGRGPAVIVISGLSGPKNPNYQSYAAEIAGLGYYTVLLDGRDVLSRDKEKSATNLRMAIERALRSPHALPGKTAVIGFSLGGGSALRHAARMPDLVSVIVAYYPFTSFPTGAASLAQDFRVPILVMAGGRDRFLRCCLIESARAMEAAAREVHAKFELVEYPEAGHNFNHPDTHKYRRNDSDDAWRRTIEMLRRYQPLQ
jgi:dienelactone hydrolase